MAGALLPATGLANRVVVNQALADAQAGEAERQDRIVELLGALDPDAPDAATLSALADAYLAGSSGDDLVRAAVTLQLLVEVEPDRADAYERLMTAYLRAGDYRNARAVHDSYATVATADPVEVAFFDGLIALRGENDAAAALDAFERFLAAGAGRRPGRHGPGPARRGRRRPLALVDHAGEHPLERREVVGRQPVEEVRGHAPQVRGRGASQAAAAGIGQRRPLAPAVVLAAHALHQSVRHETVDEARDAGAGQEEPIGQLAHAQPAVRSGGELHEHVVVGEGEVLVGLELPLELAHDARMRPQERAPGGETGIVARDLLCHMIARSIIAAG